MKSTCFYFASGNSSKFRLIFVNFSRLSSTSNQFNHKFSPFFPPNPHLSPPCAEVFRLLNQPLTDRMTIAHKTSAKILFRERKKQHFVQKTHYELESFSKISSFYVIMRHKRVKSESRRELCAVIRSIVINSFSENRKIIRKRSPCEILI